MIFGIVVKGQWLSWVEVRELLKQKDQSYEMLKEASEKAVADLQGDLNLEKSKVANLRSKWQQSEATLCIKEDELHKAQILNNNLAEEVSGLRNKNRDLRYRIGLLSQANAKMKKQLDSLPQRGKGGRFMKKQTTNPELNIENKEADTVEVNVPDKDNNNQ